MSENVSLVIQAGGRSSRMGMDKALKPFLGKPLVLRMVERLGGLAGEVLVTSNQPEDFAFLGLRILPDVLLGRGPLGGLYTALKCAALPLVAVAACDLPFASLPLFQLAREILEKEGVDIVVPRSEGGLEPMHAVYRRETCLPVVEAAVEAGEWKAIDWFPRVQVHELTVQEIALCDPSGLAFWNLNTPEEFTEAERRAKEIED